MEEFRLGTIEDATNKITVVDIISETSFQQARNYITGLIAFRQNIRLLEIFHRNGLELLDYHEVLANDMIAKLGRWNGITEDNAEDYRLEINRLLLNWLGALKTYLDHCETYLNHSYGAGTAALASFKGVCASYFDGHFTYRFLVKLRNYAQHCGLPVDRFSFKTENDQSYGGKSLTITVEFSPEYLLQQFNKWGPVKADLQNRTEGIAVFPLVREMNQLMKMVGDEIETILRRELLPVANWLNDLTRHLQREDNKVYLFSEIQCGADGKVTSLAMDLIPYRIIESILPLREN